MKIVDVSTDRRLLVVLTAEGKRETIHVSDALAEELTGIADLIGREVRLTEVRPNYFTWRLSPIRRVWATAFVLGLVGLGVIALILMIALA